MSLRTLVKERKAATRLEHEYARYSSNGKLLCSVCNVPIKHETLFAAHLASKQHRSNLVQYRQAEQARRAKDLQQQQQQQAIIEYPDSDAEEDPLAVEPTEGNVEPDRKRPRLDNSSTRQLPADFFSDPSQAPPAVERSPTPEKAAPAEDEDWLAFEREVLGPKPGALPALSDTAYNTQATMHAAPQLYNEAGEEEMEREADAELQAMEDLGMSVPESEEERRARLDLEEREELLSRIEEEERDQLEADARVEAMKRRLTAVREAKATLANAEAPKLDLRNVRGKKKAKKGIL